MLSAETQETIARFLGLFSVEEFDPKLRAKVYPGEAQDGTVQPHQPSEDATAAPGGASSPSVHLPHLRYANDHFEIVEAATKGLHAAPIETALDPLHVGAHAHHAAGAVVEPPVTFDVGDGGEPGRTHHGVDRQGGHVVHDPTFGYRDVPSDSLLATYSQGNLLDDRDTLILDPDAQPLDVVDAVTQRFEAMVELGAAAHAVPEIPHDAAGLKAMLATSAYETRGDAAHAGADGPAGHEGVYVDGQPATEMPDLSDLIERFTAESSDEAPSSLDTGSNLLRNEAGVLNIADLGLVSVVRGDWHETNSIRQINLYADGDDVSGGAQGGAIDAATRSLNVAEFERIDATPGAHPASGPLPAFATHYQVDVIEGDLQITNVLSQLNFTLDGDRIVLGTLRSDASIASGGNEPTNFADILKSLGEYDLVIVGGSVFEGNFIQQLNILSDQDRIAGDGGAAGWDGTARTGDNLLLNNAHITNYGGIGDFTGMSAHMRDLVASFEQRAATGTADLGADLAFLQSQHIRVLYIAGDVYETNVISQMNVLDDSDTVLAPNGALARFVEAAGPNAAWSISTGHNGLINNASIVDVDDASHLRFVGGEYYSDSMLLQAGLVSPQTDVMTFDVNSLAPELIAFMTDLNPADPGTGADGHHLSFETHADGVAGILA